MPLDGHLDATVRDAAVSFTFTVQNAGSDPVDLEFRSGKTADIAVYDEDTEVWRWSEGMMFTQAIRTETLGSSESLTHEATWEGPRPGEYTAVGTLDAANRSLKRQVEFTV